MKICAIICEYNPFHNGHLYQLREAKRRSGADAILCLMSGNFVQRGEAAVTEKRIRAKHAVLAGADIVLELPAVFATSNAELFAKGAVHILSSIPAVTTLCFGVERASEEELLQAATLLNDEPTEISDKLKELTASGISYAKARAEAWSTKVPPRLLLSPNTILALEYTKAILEKKADIRILPIERVGGSYKDETLYEDYSSASAIRAGLAQGNVGNNLPDFVKNDLPKQLENKLDALEKYAILQNSTEEIAAVCDCTEGLENALKKAATKTETLSNTLTSARYTSSRIRRIALQNLLGIRESLLHECLHFPLYLRVLAIKKEKSDLLSLLSESVFPLLARPRDEVKLQGVALDAYARDVFAEKLYTLLYESPEKQDIFI